MKNLLLIFLLSPLFIFGQEASEPGLFEVVYMTVKKGKEKAFETAVKAHNMKFHKEGTSYEAGLMYILNGPDGGRYSWIMGPTNFAAMDDRPGEGAHDEDWKNVSQYVDMASSPTYWSADKKLSVRGTNVSGGKSLVWIYDLKSGSSQNFMELVSKVKEVYEAKMPEESLLLYWNEFADTKAGRDAAIVFPFSKWGWLDKDSKFSEHFEAVHGPNSYNFFINEFRDCVEGRVDFMRERID